MNWLSSLVLVVLVTQGAEGEGKMERQTCSASETETFIQKGADAVIGGVFSMHRQGSQGYGCGEIGDDMQSYEAVRWALELLNKKNVELNGQFLTDSYVPGIKLGMNVQDYCSQSSTAVYKAESFFPGLTSDSVSCTKSTANMTLGIIGADTSDDTKEVSKFGAQFDIPVISFSSTVSELSKLSEYPTFMRTVPPDGFLMDVIVSVLKRLGWKYVIVVYTDNTYGRSSFEEIRPRLNAANICLTTAIQTSPTDTQNKTLDPIFQQITSTLESKTGESVIGTLFLGTAVVAEALLKRGPHFYSSGSGKIQWVFTDSISLNSNFGNNLYPRGILVVVPQSRFIVEFEDHWVRIKENETRAENPWFQKWYEKRNDCSFSGPWKKCVLLSEEQKRKAFTQDMFVEPAVHAVYAYARALRDAQQDKCGKGSSGVCSGLLQMRSGDFLRNYLMKVNFTYSKAERIPSMASYEYEPYKAAARLRFGDNGDITDPKFDVWNYNNVPIRGVKGFRFRKIGSYVNKYLDINVNNIQMFSSDRTTPLTSLPPSPCPSTGCKPCLGDPFTSKYLYIHGDIVINGIFTLHNQGPSPFTCGLFDTRTRSGAQAMQAFVYALENVKNKFGPNFLRGVNLGGLAFDDCSNTMLGASLISQVQHGSLQVQDLQGNRLKPESVDAFVAAHTSPRTVPVAELMNTLKHPVVGYASTSSLLDDRSKYPYYLRVNPGVTQEVLTIIHLLKEFKWFYVQTVVVSDDAYSRNGNDELRRLGAEEGICVVAENELDDDVVTKLRRKKAVRPVVVIAQEWHHRKFLERLAAEKADGEFSIIASSTWGDSRKIISGHESTADGVISLKWHFSPLTKFSTYLKTLRADTYKTNPWFKEWYEVVHQCSLGNDNPKGYKTNCSDIQNKAITDSKNFELDPYTSFVIDAVYAVAYGLDKTLIQLCGQGYNGVCGNYLHAANQTSLLLNNIRSAVFTMDDTVETFRFYGYGGDIPLDIYNYHRNSNNYILKMQYTVSTRQVSKYESIKLFNGVSPDTIKPTCPYFCPECMYLFNTQKYLYIDGDVIILAVADVHRQGENPFSCGSLRDVDGFQYTEAFKFAIDYINSGKVNGSWLSRNNFKLGGLLLDGCTSATRSTTLVSSLMSGLINFKSPSNRPIKVLDYRGWLTYDSQSTINIADMLSPMQFPVVSPAATSPVLMDKKRFTSLFRTVPSDKHIAMAMVDLARSMGWTHVMTLNAPDVSSRDTLAEFKKLTKERNICILASFEFKTDGSPTLIMQSMAKVKTQVVMVFSEPDVYIGDLLKANQALSPKVKFLFVSNRYWDVPSQQENVISGSVFFRMNNPDIGEFIQHMMTLDPTSTTNPWLAEYYEKVKGCTLYGSTNKCSSPYRLTRNDFKQDIRVLSTINAVFALAQGIDQTMTEACGGQFDSTCTIDIPNIIRFLEIVKFNDLSQQLFKFVNREANRGFDMRQYYPNSVSKGSVPHKVVGTYWNQLNLTESQFLRNQFASLNISGSCGDECREICVPSSTNFQDFTHIYGDIYFVGLFDIHHRGKDSNPYGCSSINNKHGYQLLEAFNFALEYVNNKKGIFKDLLPGVDIGGIGLDVCQNPLRAGNLIANIHSRNIKLQRGSLVADPHNFDTYIGPFDSESAIRVADVLTAISIPQITYGATSLELQNPRKYRYFLRSVPADDKQARAIISYLKRWNIEYVQIISSFDSVGEKGKEEFLRLAVLNRICVSQQIVIGQHGTVTREEAQRALNKVKSNARVVVLFVDDPRPILEVTETMKDIYEKHFFIGTDKWGNNMDILAKIPNLIRNKNAVTLDVETADVPEFDEYLENKVPSNYIRNTSWFLEAFQEAHQCFLKQSTNSRYPRMCTDKEFGISRSSNYVQDPYVLYVINAVFSAAIGVHNALKELCNGNYYGICSLFLTSGERRETIYKGTRLARFTDNTKQPFYFTKGGESDRGYHLYKPEMGANSTKYQYTNIGSYNDTDYLKLWIQYGISVEGDCRVKDACQCKFPEYQPSRYMLVDKPFKQFDLNLVYVGAVHDKDPNNAFRCGPIFADWHFQQIMAFFYAIELVNKDRTLPGSLKLGGLVLDTCNQPMRLGQDMYSLLSGTALCHGGSVGQVIAPKTIVSVIPFSSQNSILLSSMLSPLKITTLSPAATSVELSNKHQHPYFLRTVPPDNIQVLLMLQVLKSFGWTYATVVYTESVYGQSAVKALLGSASAADTRACIANKVELKVDMTLAEAEQAVDRLSQQVGANVVILFVEPHQIRLLLEATRNKGLTGRFVWLASDYWGSSHSVTKELEEQAKGAITIQIRSENVKGFISYMTSLTLDNRHNIPDDWFEEFYQTIHNCRLLNSVVTRHFAKICTGQERITADMVKQDNYVLSTIISVFMVAYGLNNIEQCRQLPIDISACLALQQNKRWDMIFNGISKAQWAVLPDQLKNNSFQFRFTDQGYGDVRYNILNYYRNAEIDRYIYQQIGYYKSGLTLNKALYYGAGNLDRGVYPNSKCPSGSSCQCLAANGITLIPYAFESSSVAGYGSGSGSASSVRTDWSYFDVLTGKTYNIPFATSRFPQIWALVVATLAGIGVFVSLCMFIYLLVVYPVRGGTSILGYILCFGIILLYGLVFAFIAHASEQICGLRRFALGFVYALCYSALFVKLIDCWRGRSKDEVKYSKLGKPCGFFMIVLLLVAVQVIICTEWLILQPPFFTYVYYNSVQWPRCTPIDVYDLGLVLSLIYVMILIVLCIIFGFATFGKSKNHHESRWILGIAVLSVPTWVIWCLVSTIGVLKVRDAAVAIGLLINATIMLLCGPLRKLWLLSRYQALIEEEDLEYEKERGNDYDYASVYGRQYDNAPRLQEGSVRAHYYTAASMRANFQPHHTQPSQRESYHQPHYSQTTSFTKTVSQQQQSEGAAVVISRDSQMEDSEGATVVISGDSQGRHSEGATVVISGEPSSHDYEGTTVIVSGDSPVHHTEGGTIVISGESQTSHSEGATVIISEPQTDGYHEGGTVVISGESQRSHSEGVTVMVSGDPQPYHSEGATVMVTGDSQPYHSEGATVMVTGDSQPYHSEGATVMVTGDSQPYHSEGATVFVTEGSSPHVTDDPAVFISGESHHQDSGDPAVFVLNEGFDPHGVETSEIIVHPGGETQRIEYSSGQTFDAYEEVVVKGK